LSPYDETDPGTPPAGAYSQKDGPKKLPSADIIQQWHQKLLKSSKLLKFMHEQRGLASKTLADRQIGHNGWRYTIPIHDESGALVNVRLYDPNAKGNDKMISIKGHGEHRLFILGDLATATHVAICEGELDAIKFHQETGIVTVCSTGGTDSWKEEWSLKFRVKNVVILYDNDPAGLKGAAKVARKLLPHAKSVRMPSLTMLAKKGDVTDWFVAEELSAALLRQLINNTAPLTALSTRPWPVLAEDAWHGLASEVVRTMEPYTEADAVGLLATFLTVFGNLVGPGTYAYAGDRQHPGRLNTALVGNTSKARKGTAQAAVDYLMRMVETPWDYLRGLATGEGLVKWLEEMTPDSGPDEENDDIVVIQSPPSLLVVEEEFSKLLAVASREGTTLSQMVRGLWDTGDADIPTKKDPLRVRGAHVSQITHITIEELQAKLTTTDIANGFANRYEFFLVRRGKLLPHGVRSKDRPTYEGQVRVRAGQVKKRLADARDRGELQRTEEADKVWEQAYERWDDEGQAAPGMVGSLIGRIEAHALRLSLVYALLDGANAIGPEHVRAAIAVVDYAADTARYLYGDQTGNKTADRLLAGLREVYPEWLDGEAQRNLFSRHVEKDVLTAAREVLHRSGLAETRVDKDTGGRPSTLTRALPWG
jgi:hypothetical protein